MLQLLNDQHSAAPSLKNRSILVKGRLALSGLIIAASSDRIKTTECGPVIIISIHTAGEGRSGSPDLTALKA
jgi:hypothetical protein